MGLLKRILPYLVLVGLWTLFFWRFVAPAGDRLSYAPGDFSQQFGLFRDIAYHSLIAGRLPLWAECLDSGYPFYADPQAQLFYPPLWLIYGWLRLQGWGNFPLGALTAEAALHYLLASLLTFWFLRSLQLRRAAALLGALVYAYGGYLTGWPPLQTAVLEVSALLPLTLLCAGSFARTRRPRALVFAALALALAYLAGHPQTFFYLAVFTAAYFAFEARRAGWQLGQFAGGGLALGALAGGLTAVQLLPTLQFIASSTRTAVSFAEAGHGLPFGDVLQLFVVGVVSTWQPLYVGILPLGLAVYALARRQAQVRFWAAVALGALVLSYGTRAVAYDVLYWTVPGYSLFRDQERFAIAVSFALAVLAAYGADSLFGPLTVGGRRALRRLLVAAGALAVLALLLLAAATYAAKLSPAFSGQKLTEAAGLLLLNAGLAAAALAVRQRVPPLRRWAPALVLGVAALDLFAAGRPLNVVPAYDPYPYNPLLDAIYQQTGFFRVQDDAQLPGHAGCAYGYRAIESVTPYRVATYARFMSQAPELVRWQVLGVEYVVSWRAQIYTDAAHTQASDVVATGAVPDAKGNVTTVHRLGLQPQRAFLAHRVLVATTDDAVYDPLAAPDFSPTSTVVLLAGAVTGAAGDLDQVQVVQDGSGLLALDTSSQGAGVLVASESYYPGWQVSVDGQPAPLLRADGALLAVSVPAGQHQVRFAFQPRVLAWGAGLSGLSLLVALGLLIFDWRRS
jgi:hypothetical protein